MCISIFCLLYNIKKTSLLSFIGENSLLYYLFDWMPASIVSKTMTMMGMNNPYLIAVFRIVGVVLFTPLIVVFIKWSKGFVIVHMR